LIVTRQQAASGRSEESRSRVTARMRAPASGTFNKNVTSSPRSATLRSVEPTSQNIEFEAGWASPLELNLIQAGLIRGPRRLVCRRSSVTFDQHGTFAHRWGRLGNATIADR